MVEGVVGRCMAVVMVNVAVWIMPHVVFSLAAAAAVTDEVSRITDPPYIPLNRLVSCNLGRPRFLCLASWHVSDLPAATQRLHGRDTISDVIHQKRKKSPVRVSMGVDI